MYFVDMLRCLYTIKNREETITIREEEAPPGSAAEFQRSFFRSSYRCGWCRFEPRTGHMWDKPSSACGCVRWFSRGTPVSSHLPIGSSRYE